MPTKSCINEPKLVAQTLFLGASVSSFNTSLGWGSQPSQLTVNLIEDDFAYGCGLQPPPPPLAGSGLYDQFLSPAAGPAATNPRLNPRLTGYDSDHYHTCRGDACYIDRYTNAVATDATAAENKILPGKVYYQLDPNLGLVSKYWTGPDPGFFGRRTRMKEDGAYITTPENEHPGYYYDIIDTPVYFKMGDFSFGGFVQSWNRTVSSGGKSYSVIINGPQAILNSCYVIVDRYAGSIFSKANSTAPGTNFFYGSPKNYIGTDGTTYDVTDMSRGVLPNVFNVYGFLESLGVNNFGVAKANDSGVSINSIIDGLMALTSTIHSSTTKIDSVLSSRQSWTTKKAFSPFGRIISKCMQREDYISTRVGGSANNLYAPIESTFNEFGIINPQDFAHLITPGPDAFPRCQFVLDLHDLIYSDNTRTIRRLPDDIRVTGPIITIMDLINLIAEQTGQDVSFEMMPAIKDGRLYHVIKVKAASRLQQPRSDTIDSTIKLLQCSGFPVSSNSVGKEKNETPARAMILGGQQQRLLQIKSYRLAYTQSSFIYDPRNRKFINYFSLKDGPVLHNDAPTYSLNQSYGHGKIRFPNFNTTRNNFIADSLQTSSLLEESYKNIIKDEYEIQKLVSKHWETQDLIWKDTAELRDGVGVHYGNYNPATKTTHGDDITDIGNARWFPLYLDLICPFFGYVTDDKLTMKVSAGSTDSTTSTREIRQVFLDTWTGQLAVVVRVSELPQLSVSLNRSSLESNTVANSFAFYPDFPLPYTYTPANPVANTAYGATGNITAADPVEYFILTESEIRAALAGFDNFLVYCLAKTYKPDLIEMVRRAYFIETRKKLVDELGMSLPDAIEEARSQTDWYWKLLGSNIAGDTLYPTVVSPDKSDGSQYIQEKALQDLKIIHKFVSEIGKYYGKKYMVHPGNGLYSFKDESLANIAFPTNVGYGYAFSGDGKISYNYTPTNDGAWEEYGNILDDSIVVGGSQWYNLSDDQGKIKPLLGYNNNYYYDYIRHAKCEASKNANFVTDFARDGGNPYFSYSSWLALTESKRGVCADNFTFPSLDFSSLSPMDYVVIDQKVSQLDPTNIPTSIPSNFIPITDPPLPPGVQPVQLSLLTLNTVVKSYDAWNVEIAAMISGTKTPLPKSKLYVSTSVEEEYSFLDSGNMLGARILVDAPGITLNVSSTENAKDPNRTVLANIAAEDLIIYLKTNQGIDWDWVRYMLNYITPASYDDEDNPHYLGIYSVSANSSANNVELAPKVAHPFFVGVPIRSNQYVYGPWINYPYVEYKDIYPTGISVDQNNAIPPTCTSVSVHQPDADEARRAINNLITAIDIELKDDYVPWNFGGMSNLDLVAFKELETKVNYQSVVETAQIDMPGLPMFNLGGVFYSGSLIYDYILNTGVLVYKDVKENPYTAPDLSYIPGAVPLITGPQTNTQIAQYVVIDLRPTATGIGAPIISNIQCSIGQQGISTSYSFRTYTRKIGLFNKEESDRIKKINLANIKRNKQIASIGQELRNVIRSQKKTQDDERLNKSEFGSSDLSSRLFGWSPSMVLIGQATPLINEPDRTPDYIEDYSLNSRTNSFNTRTSSPTSWKLPTSGTDIGDNILVKDNVRYMTTNTSATTLKNTGRISTTVQLYERKEVGAQLDKDYGMQSAMSLDGLLSPISFYPTYKNATFSYSLHITQNCPFCMGTKVRKIKLVQYDVSGTKQIPNNGAGILILCDKCGAPGEKLNSKIKNNKSIPINLITLNPIVVPYGEFKNTNTQNYSGAHPEGVHNDISSESPGYDGQIRHFRDRMRHCIEIVARGSVPPSQSKYALETSRNLTGYMNHANDPDLGYQNSDYSRYDSQLFLKMKKLSPSSNRIRHENNQRFFGLRGPLVLHSWGYDEDGYPVPNAADEPYAVDQFGRPKRFKLTISEKPQKKYKILSVGDMFKVDGSEIIYSKSLNDQDIPSAWSTMTRSQIDNTMIRPIIFEDDLANQGGFEPENGDNAGSLPTALSYNSGYKGSIISKTQKYVNGRWTKKYKLNQFYLNWAERPDLWRVGPIDLSWDDKRKLWVAGQGCGEQNPPFVLTNTNDIDTIDEFLNFRLETKCPYRDIYVTLEEDMIKQPDYDETYATRAFIDDMEYSKQPLQAGYRRLVYVKDRCGYCAPMGTKLLCRYDKLSGFYEPISKPVVMAKGVTSSGSQASLTLQYIQGRRSNVAPVSVVSFDNPMGFIVASNQIGMFTFINGKWTLTSIKQ